MTDEREARTSLVQRAYRLELLTVAWNVLEGVLAIGSAVAAGSVVLLGFGIDSFVECASAGVMLWRLQKEKQGICGHQLASVELRARRLVALSLFLLAAYVTCDACRALWHRERPEFSVLGSVLLAVSAAVMLWLAGEKRRVAHALKSEAMAADAVQTTACWWLSLTALVGLGLNGLLGWWWADPLAALFIAVLVLNEGRVAWKGRPCC